MIPGDMLLQELFGNNRKMPKEWALTDITGLAADSRQVEPGFLFAALPGVKIDGARFIPDAIKKGAVAVLGSEGAELPSVPYIADPNPRRAFAMAAAAFYEKQPEIIAAVTGTNGKTSVASFLRQIWTGEGIQAASFGTTGIFGPAGEEPLGLTTPDPVKLHQVLAGFAEQGVSHCAMEASSHGLEQCRLDGVRLSAGAFTNISRDHLDYHGTFENYFSQKLRLFSELLPEGAGAVIDMDAEGADRVLEVARKAKLNIFTVGRKGDDLCLARVEEDGLAQKLSINSDGSEHSVRLPLAGGFQAQNALVAAGLAIVCGMDTKQALAHLEQLDGACGRLELAGCTKSGASVFIDYAHTPDALETALLALRPYVTGRLIVVFGAGGDRDKGKRPLMGKAAADNADMVIVTDDNPRGEDAGSIRKQIMAAAPDAREISPRGLAIETAVAELGDGDVLLVAGKGHEQGQVVGDEILPFSDHEAVKKALGKTS